MASNEQLPQNPAKNDPVAFEQLFIKELVSC